MNAYVSMNAATHNLNELLARLSLGETLTLADENGAPIALLVSLQATAKDVQEEAESKTSDPMRDVTLAASADEKEKRVDEWVEQMKALAVRVSAAWQGEKSGLEELAEMRR